MDQAHVAHHVIRCRLLKKRGFTKCWVTWRAMFAQAYLGHIKVHDVVALRPAWMGLLAVPAQCRDVACQQGQ